MSRNSVAVWDADLARKQAQAELREKAAPKPRHEANKLSTQAFEISGEQKAKMAAALQLQMEKYKQLADERRRRDPTFREDAIDLDRSKMRKFNKYVDYYEVLGVEDRFCAPVTLKEHYKKKSLELHPDKQLGKTEEDRVKAEEQFHAVQKAYDILTEPATRQAYDKARAKIEAELEAGVCSNDQDESTKPPPSCVDVPVPLEELFNGVRKVVRYTRVLFEGTKWEKRTDDTYKLDIRPGELEGATYWFKNEGDVTTGGKADLVFVVVQEAHTVWERVGTDLWYLMPPETPPLDVGQHLYFTVELPTLEGAAQKRIGTRVATVAVTKPGLAMGDCVAARLGYDRTGFAEAVIRGKGMPLFAKEENARRGSGEVEEREQAAGPTKAVKPVVTFDPLKHERGDLIVKVPLRLLDRHRPHHTLRLAPYVPLCMPPIALVTSAAGGASPLRAFASLCTHVLLPAILERLAQAHAQAQRSVAADEDATEPIDASEPSEPPAPPEPSLLEAAKPAEPPERPAPPPPPSPELLTLEDLEGIQSDCLADDVSIDPGVMQHWTREQVYAFFESGGVDRPTDEEIAAAHAAPKQRWEADMAAWRAEAAHAAAMRDTVARVEAARAAAAAAPKQTKSDRRSKGLVRQLLTGVCLRIGGTGPSEPTVAAQGLMHVLSSALPQMSWRTICQVSGVSDPILPDEETAIQHAAVVIVEAAPDQSEPPGGGPMIFDPKQGKLVPAKPKEVFFVPSDATTKLRDETEDEELVSGKESDVVRTRGETEYLTAGAGLARELIGKEPSQALYQCHLQGGVLIAVDLACPLLGQTTKSITPKQKKDAAAAALAAAYAPNGAHDTKAGGGAGSSPAVVTQPPDAASLRDAPRLGTWPMILPYAIGLAPPSKGDPTMISWRRLAGTSKDVPDCAHGFAAAGLPPGSAVAALTARGCKLRVALGSAQPRVFPAQQMKDRIERLAATRQRQKVEADCEKRLMELERAYRQCSETWPPEVHTNGPYKDAQGVPRGHCPRCNGCPGFELPKVPHEPNLLTVCVHCGCPAVAHEEMRTAAQAKADKEDDILKNHRYDT